MAERETREFTTPGGHKVVLKTYLIAREFNPIADAKDDLKNSEKTLKLAEVGIVTIDGSPENVSERLLDLPLSDYTAVVKELNQLFSDLTETK